MRFQQIMSGVVIAVLTVVVLALAVGGYAAARRSDNDHRRIGEQTALIIRLSRRVDSLSLRLDEVDGRRGGAGLAQTNVSGWQR